MISRNRLSLLLSLFIILTHSLSGQLNRGGGGEVQSESELLLEVSSVKPGSSEFLYLKLTHPEGWYSYYFNNAVPTSIRPTITFQPVPGVSFSALEYPVPQIKESFGIPSYVYPGEVFLRLKVSVSEEISAGTDLILKGSADWQICKESCLSEQAELSFTLPVRDETPQKNPAIPTKVSAQFSQATKVSATAQVAGEEVVLSVSDITPEKFYSFNGGVDFNVVQKVEKSGDHWNLHLPLDQGNDFRDPAALGNSLQGYVIAKEGAFWVDVPLSVGAITAPQEPVDYIAETLSAPIVKLPNEETLAVLYNPEEPISYRTLRDSAPMTFWFALLGAFVGGILLNLMPCVFPVLSLKVLSFVEKAGEDAWKIRLHGLLFTLGVMLSMWGLAGALFAIKASTGESVNWGQQMGDPRFVAVIVIILFLFGLNMAGVFELGTKLTSVGSNTKSKNDYIATIFSGVVTTIVATPCSGPFLGAAMGYTLDQPLEIALVIFTVFALGISFPYLLLSFFPALTAKMPRPGAWMETLKKVLSFGMFAAAAFFLKTFGAQTGVDGMALFIMALVVIGLGAYFYGHWTLPHLKKEVRYGLGFGLSLTVLALGGYMSYNASTQYKAAKVEEVAKKGEVQWIPWQPGIVEHYQQAGKYVWVDYTADWCLTCQVNKRVIFKNEEFVAGLDLEGIVFVKADMTDNNPMLAKDLSRVDRAQIPVNLLYAPDTAQEVILLEEVISVSDAAKGLELIGFQKEG